MFVSVMRRYAWLWDVDMDAAAFDAALAGQGNVSLEHRRWAILRLIEYAPYPEIRRLLPRDFFVAQWPTLASPVRSRTRREGRDFLCDWYREHTPTHGEPWEQLYDLQDQVLMKVSEAGGSRPPKHNPGW